MPDMQPLSPISVHERYSSPTAGSAKRRLFGDDSPNEMQIEKILTKGTKLTIAPASSIGAENMSASPGHTVLTMTTTTGPGKAGQKVTIPLHGRNYCWFSSLLGCFLCSLSMLRPTMHLESMLLCLSKKSYFVNSNCLRVKDRSSS